MSSIGPLPPTRFASGGTHRGELGWIDWIRQRAEKGSAFRSAALQLGIGDDCAILRPDPGEDLVITTDFTLEGRHFRRDWHSAESAGHRTLARGLSDLAAMGARPLAAFLSLALPARSQAKTALWTERFLAGLFDLGARWSVPLAGGDTSESPSEHLLADIVLLGATPRGTALRRSGARPGDSLFVTGALGGAAAELLTLRSDAEDLAREVSQQPSGTPGTSQQAGPATVSEDHPQLFPQPRLRIGQLLRAQALATACMDLSDGLSTDLDHLCKASGVAAVVDLAALPVSPWVRRLPTPQQEWAILHGGEDYELLFTAPPGAELPAVVDGVSLTRIGTIVSAAPGEPVVRLLRDGREKPLEPAGWEHMGG